MWNKIYLNSQSIESQLDKSYLINMPLNSDYKGYSFYHPSTLIRNEGGKGYHISISFTDAWKFTLKKYKKSKFNSFDIIDEKELNAKVIMEQFNPTIKNSVKQEKDSNDDKEKSYLEIIEPQKIDKDVEVVKSLKNKK